MSQCRDRSYITTPIYYVNDKPHIGHSYTSVAADVFARFLRLDGYDVRLTTGTDEHGQKILQSAQKSNMSTVEFTNMHSSNFLDLAKLMQINYSDFIRTTELRHKVAAQHLWKLLERNDCIYLDRYSGWYAERDEAFYQDSELIDGVSPSGAKVEWLEESSYFFKLSKFTDKLLEFYKNNPDFIKPRTRYNEVVSFVKGGLKDLSISRVNLKYGISVPGDDRHTIYVWLDALTNYLTSLGYPDTTGEEYKNFWERSKIFHIIGKDILRFHAVYWPAFLMAANLPLPKFIIAHGWWTNDGQKISKSLGNAIDPVKLLETFSSDDLRYFVMREVPFGNDGNFSMDNFQKRINSELANNIGNLVQRTLMLIMKNCNTEIPDTGNVGELPVCAYNALPKFKQDMCDFRFHDALEIIQKISGYANEYIDKSAPWKLAKDNKGKMNEVLFNVVETIRCIGIMLQAFIPESADRILNSINIPNRERKYSHVNSSNIIKSTKIKNPVPVFRRYND